jgi:hypothetical protein
MMNAAFGRRQSIVADLVLFTQRRPSGTAGFHPLRHRVGAAHGGA